MVLTRGARVDDSNPLRLDAKLRLPSERRLVVATVGPQSPTLEGVDWVRIDAARDTLVNATAVRDRQGRPAVLDIPGPRTPREGTTLTTSEFLVHAAVEEYEWVNLRGVRHAHEIERAREFLPDTTRLTFTVASTRLLRHGLSPLVASADGLILSLADLERSAGTRRLPDLVRVAVLGAAAENRPCFAISGLLPSMRRRPRPQRREVLRMTRLGALGCAGFILSLETLDGDHAQACVDVARMLGTPAPEATTKPGDRRGGAKVGGVVGRSDGEDKFEH